MSSPKSYWYSFPECPDCAPFVRWDRFGDLVCDKPCGLTWDEHLRWRELRAEAKRKAREMVLKAREDALLPEAILEAVYEESERQARQLGRGHGG